MHVLGELWDQIESDNWSGTLSFHGDDLLYDNEKIKPLLKSTYKQLQDAGVLHSQRIVVNASTGVEFVCTLIGLWKLGAAVVPLKDFSDREGLYKVADDCGASFLIDGQEITGYIVDQFECNTQFKVKSPIKPTGVDLALVIYSSGSTGRPKGIQLSHNNIISALNSITEYLSISSDERILCLSPFSFDYGLYQLLFSLYRGCYVKYFNGLLHPSGLIKLLNNNQITLLPLVPIVASLLNRALLKDMKISGLKKVTNTGGHLNVDYIKTIHEKMPEVNIFCMYGLTESKRALYLEPDKILEKLGSVGKPMPGLEAKIFNLNHSNQWEEVNVEEVGELFVRGSSVMQGYTQHVESGARLIKGQYREDNWLATGDLFRRDSEGYFYFVGRNKDLIKQAGYCLYATDIENVIQTVEGVDACVVVPDSDADNQEIAHLLIVKNEHVEKDILLIEVKNGINKDYLPRKISFVQEFSYTPNGKIDRKALVNELRNES